MTDEPLYSKALLRLAADAMGAGRLAVPSAAGMAQNPACGDRVAVELAVEAGGRVGALAHQTQACLLTQASAALLSCTAPGHDSAGLADLAAAVQAMLAGGPAVAGYEMFAGAAAHGGRHVCVLLPFQAALNAFQAADEGAVRPQDQADAV